MSWLKRRRGVQQPPREETRPAQTDSTVLVFGVDPNDPASLDSAGVQYAQAGQHAQAAEAFLASARLGYPRGAYNYAVACEQAGRTEEAQQWYTFAAERGHGGASNALGAIVFRGDDLVAALAWFQQASEAGNADGARNVKVVGDLIARAEHEGAWRAAAETGDLEAGYQLGLLELKRGNKPEAQQHLTSAATAGHTSAANSLAELLDRQGDEDAALPWYRMAAEGGVQVAAFNLGATFSARGNDSEAERWYRVAAGGGHSLAQCNLGSMLMARNEFAEARKWLELAKAGGDGLAARTLAELARRESG